MIYVLNFKLVFGAFLPEDQTVERVFEADGAANLRDLMYALLNSLDFDFDHLYEFQVRKNRYGGSPMGSEGENPKLDELKLREGSKLRLVYDFGDDWTFDIAVIERREGIVQHGVKLVGSKGTVEQYPDFEDWEGGYEDGEGRDDLTPEQKQLADEIRTYELLLFNNDETGAAERMLEIWPKIKSYVEGLGSVEVTDDQESRTDQGGKSTMNGEKTQNGEAGHKKPTIEEIDPSYEMELWNALMDSDIPFLNLERYEEGIRLWSDILDTFRWEGNNDNQLKGAIGEALAGLGEREKMDEHFALWEKESPESVVRMNSHLLSLEKLEDWEAAKERLEEYLEAMDGMANILFHRAAEIYEKLGDKRKADYYMQEMKKIEEMPDDWMVDEDVFFPAPVPIQMPVIRSQPKIYPNDPCPCGSGKKYKKCCGRK